MAIVGTEWRRLLATAAACGLVAVLTQATGMTTLAEEKPPPAPFRAPAPTPIDRPLPINLPTALHLANIRPIDIALATERIQLAVAQEQRARALWLPTIYLGVDYARHDGQIQDVAGEVFGTSKSSLMVGAGPVAVFALTDAVFEPLAARQIVRAREAGQQAAINDTFLSVAEAYFSVQEARGGLAGALETVRLAEELVRRAEELAPGLVPPLEAVRARTELARRRLASHAARERWRVNSAELVRILRLDPALVVEPQEPPHVAITLVPLSQSVDDLVPVALLNRPELATQKAVVQATLDRLRQEKVRPLIPSVLLRGNATNPAGILSSGTFGGGRNGDVGDFSARNSLDIQVLWEFQNLGFGNYARVKERQSANQLETLELFRLQDRIAAEVVQAHAQAISAADRLLEAEAGLRDAVDSVEKNFEGLHQTRRLGGNVILLVVRPQEVVAAIQALGQAYADYYGAVADYDRAQFRLYRAIGTPAQALAETLPRKMDGECAPVPQ